MGLTQAYLVLYNAACLGGWALALAQGVLALAGADGDVSTKLGSVWPAAGQTVLYFQYAMALEIFHAARGVALFAGTAPRRAL